jgi:hypothetical protein
LQVLLLQAEPSSLHSHVSRINLNEYSPIKMLGNGVAFRRAAPRTAGVAPRGSVTSRSSRGRGRAWGTHCRTARRLPRVAGERRSRRERGQKPSRLIGAAFHLGGIKSRRLTEQVCATLLL